MLKGLLISLGLILSIYLIINTLEYTFRFGVHVRAFLLFLFVGSGIYALSRYVFQPLYQLLNYAMDDEEAAKKIGSFFPEISDRLLNIVQLRKSSDSELVEASIKQKENSISTFQFEDAVEIRSNTSYLKYLFIPLMVIVAAFLISPSLFKDSTERIIKFNKEFVPEAPFDFKLVNENLLAFKNEDFELTVQLEGSALPDVVFLKDENRKIKMSKVNSSQYSFEFKKIQRDKRLVLEAAGFESQVFNINVVDRPDLRNFNVYLNYPQYLDKTNEVLNNVGNFQIPEGTQVKWQLKTLMSDSVFLQFTKSDTPHKLEEVDNQLFEFEKTIKRTDRYSINLKNEYSSNKEKILYKVDVLKDDYPKIDLNIYQDTVLFQYVALGGNISDDYGLTRLKLNYQTINQGQASTTKSVDIPLASNSSSQRYYYQWFVDSIGIKEGTSIEYWLQVWDNDGVNGSKSVKTGKYIFKVPSKEEIKKSIDDKSDRTESNIDDRVREAKELKEKIEQAEKNLKGKKDLSWQDKNLLKNIVKKKEELNDAIEELKKQNAELNSKRDRFNKQDERIKEKVEQLQEIMDQLLDEETKKLYEELKKLLDDQQNMDEIQDVLDQMNKKEKNLEQELERTLELFKRMKFDHELNEAINDLKEQKEQQESLLRETERTQGKEEEKSGTQEQRQKNNDDDNSNKNNDSNKNLEEKQDQLQEQFKDFEEKLEELNKQNQSLRNPKSMPDTKNEQENIKESQQQSKEDLKNNNKSQSQKNQKRARDQMQQMAEKMEQMQSSMQMSMMQQNLDGLRDIIHNLIKLSFDQEELMNEFANVEQSDPRFVELSQDQLKLKDDAKIVEDSLMSLANRVFQIASFVTREVTNMNDHMDKSMELIRERKKSKAVGEQQMTMTSMNNLALLLDDVLQQMQQAMADGMGKSKPGEKNDNPSLSELQQQLNQDIQNLKKSGKSGRQLSEELAKLAAQQERIRKALEKMQKNSENQENGQTPGGGIPEKMEETETDLVNKQITEKTIRRQKDILSRLLKAEDAMRERELDEERKGEAAKKYEKLLPEAFEEYLKLKEKEIELLKTVPPKLYPYYKKEVNDYFKRLENESSN